MRRRRPRVDWVHLALWTAPFVVAVVIAILMILPVWNLGGWLG